MSRMTRSRTARARVGFRVGRARARARAQAHQTEIVVDDYSYSVFVLMIEYLYTGQSPLPELPEPLDPSSPSFELAIELLELSDQVRSAHHQLIISSAPPQRDMCGTAP